VGKFGHVEGGAVGVDIHQHVGVLLSPEPSVLPVKPDGQTSMEQLLHQIFVSDVSGVVEPVPAGSHARRDWDSHVHGVVGGLQ